MNTVPHPPATEAHALLTCAPMSTPANCVAFSTPLILRGLLYPAAVPRSSDNMIRAMESGLFIVASMHLFQDSFFIVRNVQCIAEDVQR